MARPDLLLEFSGNMSGGTYTTAWIDSDDVHEAVASWGGYVGGSASVQSSSKNDGSDVSNGQSVTEGQVFRPAGRYFRLYIGGSGSPVMYGTIRKLS